jgi:hypothetical protein
MRINHTFPLSLCLPKIDLSNPNEFLIVRWGIFQFIIFKPLFALLILVLKTSGAYSEGVIAWNSAYMWVALAYNASVCTTLYCLVVFYTQCHRDLRPYRYMIYFLSKAIAEIPVCKGDHLPIVLAGNGYLPHCRIWRY